MLFLTVKYKSMENQRYDDWIAQASNDLLWAEDSLRSGYHSQVCFVCQQVAEKSLKAVALKRGYDYIKSHSVMQIAKELKINGKVEKAGKILDTYYISARYPDAFPAGAPFEFFSKEQAKEAIDLAQLIFNKCAIEINKKSRGKK